MSSKQSSYVLLDSGDGKKYEQFGSISLVRPCSQAIWHPQKDSSFWQKATASFSRENGNEWRGKENMPSSWEVVIEGVKFKLSSTDFGHIGVFPEHQSVWKWVTDIIETQKKQNKTLNILNLFAYSGGATLAAAKAGAKVCHLDASKGMVAWARDNAKINQLESAPIRWIIDDVNKFLNREIRRNSLYDGVILDPPSFGRGAQGEVFKIEDEFMELLNLCRQVLVPNPAFIALSCHTPGYTPIVLENLMRQTMKGYEGSIETGEMVLPGKGDVFSVPCGTYAKWKGKGF